jgi:cell division septation protein DedD
MPMPRSSLVIPFLLLAARLSAQGTDTTVRADTMAHADTTAARADTTVRADAAARGDSTAIADTATSTDSVFLRVQRLAANGQGDEARALVQQEYDAAPTASPRFVEALYWRAVVAATAADAERDLRTIIVDYPLSPWCVNALMRLAQLEMSRGDMEQAVAHLQRVITEHPTSAARPRASFWIGRVELEQGHAAEACRQLADAERTTAASDVELLNQIQYWQGRCVGVDTTVVAVKPADTAKSAAAKTPAKAAPKAAAAAPAAKRMWTVQVGAYNTRSSADKTVRSLKAKGYDARVFGEIAPFRVRIGRYDTHAKAESAAQKLNAKKITGFVTEAEPQ